MLPPCLDVVLLFDLELGKRGLEPRRSELLVPRSHRDFEAGGGRGGRPPKPLLRTKLGLSKYAAATMPMTRACMSGFIIARTFL